MATITGFTAERMLAMEAATIVDGDVVGNNLILTKHDGSTVDAGNVRGPTGTPGVSQAELDAFMMDQFPICSMVDFLGVAAPNAKWLMMIGQIVANGNTLYPTFYSKIPSGMKHADGTSIIMPDTRGRVSVGLDSAQTEFDTLLETGGAKTHTLTQGQLPAVTLTIDPPNTAVAISDPGHYHYIQDSHPARRVMREMDSGESPDYATLMDFNAQPKLSIKFAQSTVGSRTTGITAAVDIPAFQSPALGSGQSHPILQPYIVTLKIIKVA